jgi:hypothetical protein
VPGEQLPVTGGEAMDRVSFWHSRNIIRRRLGRPAEAAAVDAITGAFSRERIRPQENRWVIRTSGGKLKEIRTPGERVGP